MNTYTVILLKIDFISEQSIEFMTKKRIFCLLFFFVFEVYASICQCMHENLWTYFNKVSEKRGENESYHNYTTMQQKSTSFPKALTTTPNNKLM